MVPLAVVNKWTNKVTARLPVSYTSLPVVGNVTSDLVVSTVNSAEIGGGTTARNLHCLQPWVNAVHESVENRCADTEQRHISFAGFHSQLVPRAKVYKCTATLLPLLDEHINSPATVKHLMDIITCVTKRINEN